MKLDIEKYNKSTTEIAKIIDEWIFNERDRRILKRRLIDGLTYESLAEEFDLSTPRIKTIVYKCQDKVFKHI
jgi:DNA-directed RNA polymerase sigma subunit (sigma70/sigma32)